jgi:ubiquinone/menaquinone biosynthesis C-methylase UbiE
MNKMRWIQKNIIRVPLFTCLTLAICFIASGQQPRKGVLEPDNANEARLNRLQPPQQVMDAIGVKPGMVVAEIGAGRGRYVMQLAARVGEEGLVYAEDINADSLAYLKQRCQRWGVKNVRVIRGEVADPNLPRGQVDLIFIISSYHHFANPVLLMKRARPALKSNGLLAIGEWLPKNARNKSINTPQEMEAELKAAGYRLERIETFLKKNNMFIYIFRPHN